MAREEVPLDQETFDRVLAEELGKGTDRRVAEGRARSAAVRAYRKAHGEPERAARPAPAAAAPSGDGGGAAGDGGGPPTAEPAAVGAPAGAVGAAPGGGVVAPARIAPPPTGKPPSPKPGDRKIAITLFTMLFMFGATLTMAGSFFRGPGFNWVWPWHQGLFFEL